MEDDATARLQAALDRAAAARTVLRIPAGTHNVTSLVWRAGLRGIAGPGRLRGIADPARLTEAIVYSLSGNGPISDAAITVDIDINHSAKWAVFAWDGLVRTRISGRHTNAGLMATFSIVRADAQANTFRIAGDQTGGYFVSYTEHLFRVDGAGANSGIYRVLSAAYDASARETVVSVDVRRRPVAASGRGGTIRAGTFITTGSVCALGASHGNVIEDLTVEMAPDEPFHFFIAAFGIALIGHEDGRRATGNIVRRNTVRGGVRGVHLQYADRNTIEGNTVSASTARNVGLGPDADDNRITGNVLLESGSSCVILGHGSDRNVVRNNRCESHAVLPVNDGGAFMATEDARGNTIERNTVRGNWRYGIFLGRGSRDARVRENDIVGSPPLVIRDR